MNVDLIALDGAHARSVRGLNGIAGRTLRTLALTAAGVWTLWQLGIGRRALVNGQGFGELGRFFRAAFKPTLTREIGNVAWRATRVTLSYAILGTICSVAIGVVLGCFVTAARRDGKISVAARAVKACLAPIRGAHEVVWSLLLLNILGINPLVAVFSIAIPFGAVTARVFSELLSAQPRHAYNALRASGARESTAFILGIVPSALADGTSYTFYRFECAVRAAAVLGVVGAGGLGEQLKISFDELRYNEMWSFLFVLIAVSALADTLSARIRRHSALVAHKRTVARRTVATLALAGLGWWSLHIHPSTLWSKRTRTLAAEIPSDWLPPDFSMRHVKELLPFVRETIAISIGSIVLSLAIALPFAFITARTTVSRTWLRKTFSMISRFALLVARAIPPPLWAFLCVLALYPGPLPAAVALGIYNAGVLGRLLAEAFENLDQRPRNAFVASGARAGVATLLGIVSPALPTAANYGLYRWEVAMRETIMVGVAAAGGLGAHLNQQKAAGAWPRFTATVFVMIALTFIVDVISSRLRAAMATS